MDQRSGATAVWQQGWPVELARAVPIVVGLYRLHFVPPPSPPPAGLGGAGPPTQRRGWSTRVG